MAKVSLNAQQLNELVRILATYADVDTSLRRQIFLDKTGLNDALPRLMPRLPREGDAETFGYTLVDLLQRHGTLQNIQQPALALVLRYLRDEVVAGQEAEAAFLERLLAPTQPKGDPTLPLKLFVSYRRRSWAFTQRLVEQLQQSLNADIFVDLTGVDESNFERAILRNLRASDAVLVVVSEHTFSNRIHEPNDWVRREIAEALRLNKPITLVAVDGLYPPPPDQLPDDIAAIGKMRGVPFYPEPELWDGGLRRLVKFLDVVVTRTIHHEGETHATPDPIEPPPPTPASLQATLTRALEFLDVGDWDKALLLLGELAAQGYRPRYVSIEELIADATSQRNQAIRQREMMEAYNEIVPFARVKATQLQAVKAWRQFKEEYPEFDPADDTAKLAELESRLTTLPSNTSSPAKPQPAPQKITPQQQKWLDIMQDMRHPIEERAKAGIELAAIGDPRPGVGLREDGVPDILWCEVSGKDKGRPAVKIGGVPEFKDYSLPAQTVDLPTFAIAKYPITYRQFQAFVEDKGFQNDQWWQKEDNRSQSEQGFKHWNHPRETITWYAAMAYCKWLSVKLGATVRLPTEEEWEKVARGEDGRFYPWGNDYISGYANINETNRNYNVGLHYLKQTSAVGIYPPESASPYGVMDMAGNVWEWTLSAFEQKDKERERKAGETLHNVSPRVLRGGAFNDDGQDVRCAYRDMLNPDLLYWDSGFRVAVVAVSP